MQGFTWIDTAVLVIYLLGVLFAGLWFSNKEHQGKEFFKGDGTIPWWVTCVSIFATLLSPISFLSLPGNSYGGSWILWWAQIGMLIAIPLTIKYFLPIYSTLQIDTAYHYLEKRFGSKGLRILGALMFIVFQTGRMSIIMYLPCIALAELTGINVNILIIVMGIIAIIYSYSGGLKAVLWTDFIQGVVLIVGIALTLVVMIASINGGFGTVMDTLTTGHKFLLENEVWFSSDILSTSIFVILVGGGLTTFSSYVSSQDIVQRFTTITGILLAAIFAASQSTLSTGINSVATSWVLDIQSVINPEMSSERQTKIAQYISLGIGILAIIVAIFLASGDIKSAYEWFNSFIGLALGALVGMFVLGAFSKHANAKGAVAAFIVSSIIVIYLKYFVPSVSYWTYTIITIISSLVVGNIVSYLTDKSFVAPKGTTVYTSKAPSSK